MLKLLLEPAHGGRADLKAIRGYSVIRELGRGGMGAVSCPGTRPPASRWR
ncbi:hypothetical protein [Streptomyces antimycoticus]